VPEEVFNPMIWAGPSVIGVSLIIGFTLKAKKQAQKQAARQAPHAEKRAAAQASG